MIHHISSDRLTVQDVYQLVQSGTKLALSDDAKARIIACRKFLDDKIARSEQPIYGINTGFGSLCNTSIEEESLSQLQTNLVMSHACGTGALVPQEIVKLMLLLKVQGLSYGHSGVALETVEGLIWMFNNDIIPVVYEQGSLGASGDLSPLAHMSLPLLSKGEVYEKGKPVPAGPVLEKHGFAPITLQSKEGLALLNGTQFMSAYSVWLCNKAAHLADMADLIGAVSLEGYDGRSEPFKAAVHAIRNHNGQKVVADNIYRILADSKTWFGEKPHVQDPYSFRCMPQVHGASRDALAHVVSVVENEINAVTDNPTVFPESDDVISAGNFHGQPLAISLDFLKIAMAEWGSISERRIYKLVNGDRQLPAFLVANPGLNSGFMIPQYTAASIVSRNKQLCSPASVDTIDSSNGQEDHVSMGANAAVQAKQVAENVQTVLGIELFNALQAVELRVMDGMASKVQEVHSAFRQTVPYVQDDVEMYPHIESARQFVANYADLNWK